MRKYIALISSTLAVAGLTATSAAAAQPADPGCFGQDRAAYANANGSLGHDVGGVGYYTSQRAGDNGAINRAYKDGCGGSPTP